MASIKTRFLIISDTHGKEFLPERDPHHHADVAIHCGDLSEESKLAEFRVSLQLLMSLDAPLKLVIAGNHDFTLDEPIFKKKVAEAFPPLEPDLVAKEYGTWGEAKKLFEEAKSQGVVFLEEGNHRFELRNGALLNVYATPYTPSLGDWGFQYHPNQGHDFILDNTTDVVISHGPPEGIMDKTYERKRAGCPHLFAAMARNRPKLHCFGHIHEGWGAKLVAWREEPSEMPCHFTDIDNDKSLLIKNLSGLARSKYDDSDTAKEKEQAVRAYDEDRCCRTSHCSSDEHPIQEGRHTLFVNASIQCDDQLRQLPWLVDIDLAPL